MNWLIVVGLSTVLGLSTVGYQHWQDRAPVDRVGPLSTNIQSSEQLRFIAIGDFGSGDENQIKVANAMEKYCQTYKPDGILLLGDNIYMDGVASVEDQKWQDIIEKPLSSPCLANLMRYPVLGNHDYKGNPGAQIQYSKKQPKWYFPSRFYSIQFGELIEFIAIDTNIADFCLDPETCVLDFVKARLANSSSRWQVVLGHHPLSSASSKYSSTIQGQILKRFLCSANAYISAHSHHLEHRKDNDCSAELLISGGGGAHLYPTKNDPRSFFAQSTHGFLEVSADYNELGFRFFNTDNVETYSYKIERMGPRLSQKDPI